MSNIHTLSSGSSLGPDLATMPKPSQSTDPGKKEKRESNEYVWRFVVWKETALGSNGSNGSNGRGVVTNTMLRNWIEEYCKRAVWQLEACPSTGRLHWDITVSLKAKKRWSFFKNHFVPNAEIQRVEDDEDEHNKCFNYSQKAASRVEGPFYHPKKLEPQEDEWLSCKPMQWQLSLIRRIERYKPKGVWARKCYWYFETTGMSGKSVFTKHLELEYGAFTVGGGKKNDVFYAYNGEPIIVLDLSRSTEHYVSYDMVEQFKNGACFSSKYESKNKRFPRPFIIIFANYKPTEDELSKLSKDRWVVSEIIETVDAEDTDGYLTEDDGCVRHIG